MGRRTRRSRDRDARAEPARTASSAPAARATRTAAFVALGLVVLAFTVFWPVGGFSFITWDDPHYVFNNPHVITGVTLDNLKWAFTTTSPYFFPVTWVSHQIDAQLFGAWPGGHHLMAVALHALSTVLLFLFLFRTTGATWRSAFVAAVFAVHPMRVESVAWISERKDVVATLALLVTLNVYASYVRRPSLVRYLAVTLPFVLGMLAKPMLIALPFTLLAIDVWPLARLTPAWRGAWAAWRPLVVEKLPWAALAFGIVALNLAIQAQPLATFEALPFGLRFVNAFIHYTQYLAMMLWPSGLTPLHPVARTLPPVWAIAGAVALLAGLSAAALRWMPRRPYLSGWFWFLGSLVPVIGLLQAGEQGVADRFGYIAHIGLYPIVAWGLVDLAGRSPQRRRALAVAAAVAVAACGVSAREYLWNWRDGAAIWRRAVAVDPDSNRAWANLADALAEAKQVPEAIDAYRQAIRLAPEVVEYRYYLGLTLARNGRLAEALPEFDAVLKARPDDARTHDALGLALARSGQVGEAIAHLEQAIRLDPSMPSARANLGLALARKGDADGALAAYSEALRLDPSQAQTHSNRAALLLAVGRVDDAVADFAEAQRLEPYSADRLVNLGSAFSRQGKGADAAAAFDRAIALDPRNAEAYNGRGVLLSEQGQTADAIAAFTRALELNPNLVHVYSNRGRAFAMAGDVNAALRDFEHILTIDPANAQARAALDALRKAK